MTDAKTSKPRNSKSVAEIVRNPKAYYDDPMDVAVTDDLSYEESLRILKAWKVDAEALQRAEAENMSGGEKPQLHRVMEALNALEAPSNRHEPVPVALATPLGAPTAIAPGLMQSADTTPGIPAQPRSNRQLLGADRKLIFRLIVGLLLIAGLFYMAFGPVVSSEGRISTIGLGVIIFEVVVLSIGLLWLVLVKHAKPRAPHSDTEAETLRP